MRDNKVYTSYNLFFLVPLFLWLIAGAVFQYYFDNEALFKFVNTHYSSSLDVIMSIATNMGEGIFIIPVLLLLFIKKHYRNWHYFAAALLANIGSFLLSQTLKSYYNFPRPLNYFQEATWIHTLPEWERHFHRSFPSGHTTGAFALFSFLSFLLPKQNKYLGLLFFMSALSVGYSRLYLAAHFFLDVYIGSIIGVVFSILAITIFYQPSLHRTKAS